MVAVVVGVVIAACMPSKEPSYHGKRLSEWVRAFGEATGARIFIPCAECGEAIRHIGTNAVPFLLSWIQYETPPWKINVYNFANPILARLRISARFDDNKLNKRAEGSIDAFVALDDKATDAIGDLGKLVNDPVHERASFRAAAVLATLGTPGCVPLLTAVTNQRVQVSVRCYLIEVLADEVEQRERVITVVRQLALDPNPQIRSTVTNAWRSAEISNEALEKVGSK